MRRLTPHLCNLLSANQFFDTLTGSRDGSRFFVSSTALTGSRAWLSARRLPYRLTENPS